MFSYLFTNVITRIFISLTTNTGTLIESLLVDWLVKSISGTTICPSICLFLFLRMDLRTRGRLLYFSVTLADAFRMRVSPSLWTPFNTYRINTNFFKFNVIYKRFRPFAPSLNASHTDIIKQCFPQNNRFGHLDHAILLRLLFSFCVNPLWHTSNKSFDDNFSKIEIYVVGIFLSGSNLCHQGHPYDTCTMCRSYSGNNSAVHLEFHLIVRCCFLWHNHNMFEFDL